MKLAALVSGKCGWLRYHTYVRIHNHHLAFIIVVFNNQKMHLTIVGLTAIHSSNTLSIWGDMEFDDGSPRMASLMVALMRIFVRIYVTINGEFTSIGCKSQ